MKTTHKLLIVIGCLATGIQAWAQQARLQDRLSLYNKVYDVFLEVDLGKQALNVPGHDIYGPLAGYLGKSSNSFYWLVVSSEVKEQVATLQLINDYGSEDLTATLSQTNDSTFQLTQQKGSSLKLPNKGKWQKLPKNLDFQIRKPRK